MPNRRHYKNSPITEAVIDIRLEPPSNFKPESLEPIADRISGRYPKREDVSLFQGIFTIGSTATSTQTKLGYLYRSTDGKYVLQTRTNGFTLSRLAPYDEWEAFRDEAKTLWDIYREFVVKPIRVNRVASRSINRVDMPLPAQELSEYFRTFPEVSPALPQLLSGYVMHLLIPQEDFNGMLSLIQATVPAQHPNTTSINLDIDMFKESSDFDSDEKIWTFLDYLRDRKNEVFEGCITDKARELFGPLA
jgi:uncharacterized protein (TIGR04255 family)